MTQRYQMSDFCQLGNFLISIGQDIWGCCQGDRSISESQRYAGWVLPCAIRVGLRSKEEVRKDEK